MSTLLSELRKDFYIIIGLNNRAVDTDTRRNIGLLARTLHSV